MRRKLLKSMFGAMTFSFGGCASSLLGSGDFVSFSFWNHRFDQEFEEVKLRDAEGALLASAAGVDRRWKDSKGWSDGGAMSMADNGYRIPEHVHLFWRMPPRTGQKVYEGDLIGPIVAPLRSRIPREVLSKVRGSRKYALEIAFSVGVTPVLMRWRLADYHLGTPGPPIEVQRGGDW